MICGKICGKEWTGRSWRIFKNEGAKKGAYKDVVSHETVFSSEKKKKCQPRKWVKPAGLEISHGSQRNTVCSERKGVQAGDTEEESIKQRQRMEIMAVMMKKIKANGRMDAKAVVGSVNCKEAWFHPEWEDAMLQWYNSLCERKRKRNQSEKRRIRCWSTE